MSQKTFFKAECMGCAATAFAPSLFFGGYFIPSSYLHDWTQPQVSPWCSCEHDSQ